MKYILLLSGAKSAGQLEQRSQDELLAESGGNGVLHDSAHQVDNIFFSDFDGLFAVLTTAGSVGN